MLVARSCRYFGVILGTNRVVIYVEPDTSLDVTTNTARTQLLLNNEPLPWAEWASEFSSKMPSEIIDLMDDVAAGSSSPDHAKAIRDRLKQLLDLFRVSRYRPTAAGAVEADTERRVRGGAASDRDAHPRGSSSRSSAGGSGGTAGGIYSAFLKKGGAPADEVSPDLFPRVQWVSVQDGTRQPGDIEDRAARYIADQNVLQINADFRVFQDMIERWKKKLGSSAAVGSTIEDAVHNWFEQSLVETVLGVQAPRGSKEWSDDQVSRASSEEALTAATMQRYHVYNAVKRELGSKLGKLHRDDD